MNISHFAWLDFPRKTTNAFYQIYITKKADVVKFVFCDYVSLSTVRKTIVHVAFAFI